MTNPAGIPPGVIGAPYQGSYLRGSLVLQRSGERGDIPKVPTYGGDFVAQGVTLREGDHVVFAKLNIIYASPAGSAKASVICELRVGTEVDTYEMVDIAAPGMRLASLIVGANLTAPTEAKIVVKFSPPEATIKISNLVIASIQVDELTVLRTT